MSHQLSSRLKTKVVIRECFSVLLDLKHLTSHRGQEHHAEWRDEACGTTCGLSIGGQDHGSGSHCRWPGVRADDRRHHDHRGAAVVGGWRDILGARLCPVSVGGAGSGDGTAGRGVGRGGLRVGHARGNLFLDLKFTKQIERIIFSSILC